MLRRKFFCLVFLAMAFLIPSQVLAVTVWEKGDASLDVGFWTQAWYQYVSEYDTNGDGVWDEDLNDFMIRRAYLSVKGNVNPWLSFFTHFAADRVGQKDLDNPSVGLGSGLAVRGAWGTIKLAGNNLMVQAGRMYIPFTRNYGTTSTKNLLTLDLDWGQGGYRSGIFYPSKVGRDDSVTLWGNVLNDKLQYRLMIGEGEESSEKNPNDNPRFAGRLAYNFFDAETGWFNGGTYLGKKQVLALGVGTDNQKDLILSGEEQDYSAWTVDLHYDQPIGDGALTLAASYIDIRNSVNGVTWTNLASGDDGYLISAKAGYYIGTEVGPGRFQPYIHWGNIHPKAETNEPEKAETNIYGAGINYFLKGPANKLSMEVTFVDQEAEVKDTSMQNHTIFTFQLAVGF